MSACYCDYEAPSFYVREDRRARKTHRCSECGADILPGEQYEHVRGKWDGDIGTYRACTRCTAVRDWVRAHVPCLCWTHGNMLEDSIEEVGMHYRADAPGLWFGTMRRLVAVRRHQRACQERRKAA